MTRVLFMGTPEAAVPSLKALCSRFEVSVITQPDQPVGRSKSLAAPSVKVVASSLGLSVSQPASAAELEDVVTGEGKYDIGVVVAYGRLLRSPILRAPAHGILNVHFSLLPRWRGAAPVNRAIMAGDTMTGVTIIKIDEGLDTGPVLTAQAVDIGRQENAGELTARLADLGGRLIASVIEPYLSGAMQPVPQSDDGLTYASKIENADRPIKMTMTAAIASNHVRGLAPKPAATLDIDGARHKILDAVVSPTHVPQGSWEDVEGWPTVGLESGSIVLAALQQPGKTAVSGNDWLRGRRVSGGKVS